MLAFFRNRRREKLLFKAEDYIQDHYWAPRPKTEEITPPAQDPSPVSDILYSLKGEQFSLKEPDENGSEYVSHLLRHPSLSSHEIRSGLEKAVNQTFSEKLTELISQQHMRDVDVYKAAHMDRRLFSKIMSDKEYRPAKDTVLALIFGLHLDRDQAYDLLARAGYVLSHSSKRDLVIEFFIREGICDLDDINSVLEKLDFKIIGR